MNKDLKQKIIDTVAKEHHLIIDGNDPIFALITANEIALENYTKRIDQSNSINLVELENQYTKIVLEIKELAEKKIGLAIEKTNMDLQETRNKILKDIELSIKENSNTVAAPVVKNNTVLYCILTFAVALIIGLNIGIFLT